MQFTRHLYGLGRKVNQLQGGGAVRFGQRQQPLCEREQFIDPALHDLQAAAVVGGLAWALQRQFQAALERGQRGPQLMGCSAGKRPLPLNGGLQVVEHAIHSSGQVGHLVAACCWWHAAPVAAAAGDAVGGAGHRIHGFQGAVRQVISGYTGQSDHQHRPGQQHLCQGFKQSAQGLAVARDLQQQSTRQRLGQHPAAPVAVSALPHGGLLGHTRAGKRLTGHVQHLTGAAQQFDAQLWRRLERLREALGQAAAQQAAARQTGGFLQGDVKRTGQRTARQQKDAQRAQHHAQRENQGVAQRQFQAQAQAVTVNPLPERGGAAVDAPPRRKGVTTHGPSCPGGSPARARCRSVPQRSYGAPYSRTRQSL